MTKKYVIHSGYVYSKTNREKHFIGIMQLVRLYGVSPSECHFDNFHDITGMYAEFPKGMIHLYPRSDGNYKLES